jgi:hypothetical protein
MNASLLIIAAIVLSPLWVLAQDATTQPAPPVDSAGDTGVVAPNPNASDPGNATSDDPRNRRHGARPWQRSNQLPTEKELDDARQFMQQHSPQRFKALENMPDGEAKTRIRAAAAQAYLNWMRLANTDLELYSVVLKRIDLEDQIFGKFKQIQSDPVDKQDADKAELRDLVARLVDNGIKERELRLDRLRKAIDKETAALETDKKNRSEAVDKRYDALFNSEGGGLLPNPGPGPGNGGDRRPRNPQRGN